jgi:hypothetical protein
MAFNHLAFLLCATSAFARDSCLDSHSLQFKTEPIPLSQLSSTLFDIMRPLLRIKPARAIRTT